MKKLSWFNKMMLFFNIVLTVLTFLAYLLPFLAPKFFPLLSVFTLIMPVMLVLNFLFFVYWLIQLKKQMLISGIVLLLGITFINKFYKFSETVIEAAPSDFKLMSYNVRMFNLYEWLPNEDVADSIMAFVEKQNPDIVCFQEYSNVDGIDMGQYKYNFIYFKKDLHKTGQAIFSKFKIVNKGDLKFKGSGNNVIFADIKKGKDTIRVYSMHMQSIRISPDIHEKIDEEKSKVIINRLSTAFKLQQYQAEVVEKHKSECPYPMIVCGDLNNSAYSYVYRSVKGNMKDAFEEAGSGFGTTYNYKYYPARIDYIFTDKSMDVKEYKTFSDFSNSDHYPIMTRLAFSERDK
jgi:endonuclease/exonuclease/phosphatase family metal-dependent hydrolase